MKLEDLISGKDPWRGGDCKRPNCFLCNTKNITEKDTKKDCTQRNILYEIRCLSCEDKEKTRILESEVGDEEEKKEQIRKIKIPTYVGESSRSAYERGYEHLDKLASLNSNSHMLRHMLDRHKGEEFKEVRWGMFVVKFLRSAFERQIEEAVSIEKMAKTGEILNSKSEYNNCTLPRLVTRIGDPEKEMKEYEKEA